MKKIITISSLLFCCFITIACGQTPKNTYPGWEHGVEKFKEGVNGLLSYRDTERWPNQVYRDRLLNFLTDNKKLYFKDDYEYNRIRGIFHWLSGEYIECLTLWREYVAETGDYVTPRLEMHALLDSKYRYLKNFLLFDVCRYSVSTGRKVPEYASNLIIFGPVDAASVLHEANPIWYYDQLTFKEKKLDLM